MKINRTISGLLIFVVIVAALVVILRVADWLPGKIQKGTIETYGSIEEVRNTLGIDKVYVPSYFPEDLSWPPSLILAQRKPFDVIVMTFNGRDESSAMLVIIQSSAGHHELFEPFRILEVREETEYELKGRTAILQTGLCKDGQPCSKMIWKEGPFTIDVLMKASPFDTIRIAESMLH